MKEFLFTILLFSGSSAWANGSGVRGGGDTDAVEFVAVASEIGKWLASSSTILNSEESKKYSSVLESVVSRMDGSSEASVRFVEDSRVEDAFGISKMAVFSQNPPSITISRPSWKALDPVSKYELVALEFFGLCGLQGRYQTAGFIKDYFNEITHHAYDNSQARNQITKNIFDYIENTFHAPIGKIGTLSHRQVGASDVLLSGQALLTQESSNIKKFNELAEQFSALPMPYLLDVWTLNYAEVDVSKLIPARGYGFEGRGPFEPLAMASSIHLWSYGQQLASAADFFQTHLGRKLSPKSKAALKEVVTISKVVLSNLDASRFENGTLQVHLATPYDDLMQISLNLLRQEVRKQNCQIPVSYSRPMYQGEIDRVQGHVLPELGQLRHEAQAKMSSLLSNVSTLSVAWSNFSASLKELQRLKKHSGDIDFAQEALDMAYVADVLRNWAVAVRDVGDENDGILQKLLAQVRSGELCRKMSTTF